MGAYTHLKPLSFSVLGDSSARRWRRAAGMGVNKQSKHGEMVAGRRESAEDVIERGVLYIPGQRILLSQFAFQQDRDTTSATKCVRGRNPDSDSDSDHSTSPIVTTQWMQSRVNSRKYLTRRDASGSLSTNSISCACTYFGMDARGRAWFGLS